mmetsp:Transcript_27275/g.42625  ORF Transcript_27275/g.42625 Transcript_27275/m.42625 type:complete len:196 (-) Transcript_27275:763-1350(-)
MDGGAVDDEQMRKFWKRALKTPSTLDQNGSRVKDWRAPGTGDRKGRLLCFDPGSCGSVVGLHPGQPLSRGKGMLIDVEVSGTKTQIKTRNVATIQIKEPALFIGSQDSTSFELAIDNSVFLLGREEITGTAVFSRDGFEWSQESEVEGHCKGREVCQPSISRFHGPLRRIFARKAQCPASHLYQEDAMYHWNVWL